MKHGAGGCGHFQTGASITNEDQKWRLRQDSNLQPAD